MWQRWNQSTHIFEKSTDNGGSWTPLGLDASIITEGILPDARLSSNVALKNAANIFTQGQQINLSTPSLTFFDAPQPVDARNFRIMNGFQYLWFDALNDAGTVSVATPLKLSRGGDILVARDVYQSGRASPMGQWTQWAPAMTTWEGAALTGGNIAGFYMQIGRSVFWNLYAVSFTIPANTQYLVAPLPPSLPAPIQPDTWYSAIPIYMPGIGYRTGLAVAGSFNRLVIYPDFGAATVFSAGTGHVFGQGMYSI